jgi:sphingomyelin phosphodiesterase acid-like 3
LPLLKRTVILLLACVSQLCAAEFLWLSDIHFDPLADKTLVDKLAAAEPAQWADILDGGSKKFASYRSDANWPLFSSVLEAARSVQPKAAFTLVTGDLLVHHFREQFDASATVHDDEAFRRFVRKSMEFVGLELKRFSPGTPVFIALGNNDDECGDYSIQANGPFLQDTAKVVSDSGSYLQYGSYSALLPGIKNHRIIVLDTVFLSPRYRDACGHGTDDVGDKLMRWLASQLEAAKSHREKVWLMYHIPPGIDAFATARAKGTVTLLWKEAYVNRFLALLAQYSDVVGPNFAGHIHVDDFRLLDKSVVILNPAVSPITGQNPSFRLVTFGSHGSLKDQSTYVLTNAKWQLEYAFDKTWHLRGLNAQSYAKLFGQIETSSEETTKWINLYSTSNPAGGSVTPANASQFYCASGNITVAAYQACVAAKAGK